MGDSFDPPSGIFFLGVSGSRPWISDYSGLPIETQEWSGQRFVKAWISGQPVTTTVNVDLSGASFASNVSGNIVYLTSGQNPVQMSGQVVYLASGFNAIAGSFTADISGQPVRVSGQAVRISGETVQIAGGVSVSGNFVVVPFTSISGNAVRISGETVQIAGGINVSGSPVRVSGETVYPVSGKAFMHGFDESGATWNEVFMDTSGGHRIKVAISGDTVQIAGGVSVSGNAVRISGQTVIAEISGQTVQIAGGINVSGSPVRVSGETVYLVSGQNAVQMSGQTVVVPFTSVSGNMVSVSGQAVSVSGNAVRTSGDVAYLVSGQNPVQLFALDLSGLGLQPLVVNQSGGFALRVDAGAINVSANVSGNAVRTSGQVAYLVSGQNDVQISGQVVLISGQTVIASVTTNISGQTVYTASGNNDVQISGQAVRISGSAVAVSGQAVKVSGESIRNYLFDASGDTWRPMKSALSGTNTLLVSLAQEDHDATPTLKIAEILPVPQPVEAAENALSTAAFNYAFEENTLGQHVFLRATASGVGIFNIPHKLVVTFSGDSIIGSVSGNAVRVSGSVVYLTSGQNPVNNFGFIDASGQLTQLRVTQSGQVISGIPHRLVVAFSGDIVQIGEGGDTVDVMNSMSDSMSNADNALVTRANLVGYDHVTDQWSRVRVTTSGQLISGIPHKLVVTFSGDSIIGSVSGNMVSVSGQPQTVSGNIVNTSGQVAIISGQPVSVSGNTVYAVSGNAYLHAFDLSGQAWMPLRTSRTSGSNVLAIGIANVNTVNSTAFAEVFTQGDTVSTSFLALGTYGVMAGLDQAGSQMVRARMTTSGQPISGIAHRLIVAFSGDPVSISGQPVSVSGNVVLVSGSPVLIGESGSAVLAATAVTDNDVKAQAVRGLWSPSPIYGYFDESGRTSGAWARMTMMRGASGAPFPESGYALVVKSILMDDNATTVNVRVETSGNDVTASASALEVQAKMYGVTETNARWQRLRLTASGQGISGIPHKLVVTFSGDSIIGSVSGNAVSISGQTVVTSVSGIALNVSGNTVYLVSGQNAVQNSGQTVVVSGQPIQLSEGGNIVNVGVTFDDTQSNGDNYLTTDARNMAFNEESGSWARVRITQSGKGISGIPHKLVVAFSGDPVVVTDGTTTIDVLPDLGSDTLAQTVDGLATVAALHGYDRTVDQWPRLDVTTSGKGISGQVHALVVAAGVYDLSGQTLRSMVSPSSGSNALLTSTNTPPTYIAYGDNVVPTSGGVALAMSFRSGTSTLVIKKVFVTSIEPALASGQYIRFDVCRISGLFSGGTAISAFPHDPTDPISGASINMATAVTASLFPAAARNILLPWVTTTRGIMSGGTTPSPEAATAHILEQSNNILPESTEMKELRLTSGFGFMLQQTLAQTGYTQVTSGRFGFTVVYTIQ